MRNAGLEEAQAGIKIAGRNSNNLSYADDSTCELTELALLHPLGFVKQEGGLHLLTLSLFTLECHLPETVTSGRK